MDSNRRNFLKIATTVTAAAIGTGRSKDALANGTDAGDPVGCLVDTTLCIGCRKCEEACNRSNRLPEPPEPFEDRGVLRQRRRPDAIRLTVVNSYAGSPSVAQGNKNETFAKVQCMHCLDPACVSACIVGALKKSREGPVTYDLDKCIGCRYCMVACPFEIPAYEYSNPTTPSVRKCTYCVDEQSSTGAQPACAAACPVEAIVFGRRRELLDLAHQRIQERPDRYVDHVYGEKEVGGTSWLYLAGRPHDELDLPPLPEEAPPRLTESIQHGIFNYGAIPLVFYGGLSAMMWIANRKNRPNASDELDGEETSTD